MNTKKELIFELKPLMERCYINQTYTLGNEYNFSLEGNEITLQLKQGYKHSTTKKQYNHSKEDLLKTFRSITKSLNAEVIKPPTTLDLGYEDSLLWLYEHYPYGYNDSGNCVLLDGDSNIIAINYNNMPCTRFLYSLGTKTAKGIILNNKKQLEGVYTRDDIDNIFSISHNLFYKGIDNLYFKNK